LASLKKDKSKPLKVIFQSRQTVNELLKVAYKLKDNDEFKQVKIRRNMCKEDRVTEAKLDEAKLENNERSEEEQNLFFIFSK